MTIAAEAPRPDRSLAPYFRSVFVGSQRSEVARCLDEMRCDGRFECFRALSPGDLADPHAAEVAEMGTAELHGCLTVIWDLDACREGNHPGDVLGWLLAQSVDPMCRWSNQRVAFGFAEEPPALSFLDLVGLVERNVAYVGSVADCADTLHRWCGSIDGPGHLGGAFKKLPSKWLRGLRHDYLAGGVLSMFTRPHVEERGLMRDQQVVDFWQDALRNVLVHVRENLACRAMRSPRPEDEPEALRILQKMPFRLLSPEWLSEALRERDQVEGVDFVSYRTADEAVAAAAATAGKGVAHVLLWDGGEDPPVLQGPDEAPALVPVVLVGETPPKRSWKEWQGLLGRNVLGGYGRDELLSRDERGRSVLDCKPSRWRPFCVCSLPEVFADVARRMARSLEVLRPVLEGERSRKLEHSIAELGAARNLYFGSLETNEPGGEA